MKTKLVGINRLRIRPNDAEMKIYRDILTYNNIPYVMLDSSEPGFWEKVTELDYFIFKWGHDNLSFQVATSVLPVIENYLKIKCFPNYSTCWHYDDKIKQYLLLKQCGFPVVDSFVFWDRKRALEWIDGFDNFPLVFKLKNGAGSMSVFLVPSKRKALKLINKMFGAGYLQSKVSFKHLARTCNYDINTIFRYYTINFRNKYLIPEKQQFWLRHKNYIFFQKFLPNNEWDTRVTTAGNRAHAFRRFNRENDFRASGSNRWDINPDKIDTRMVRIALNISKHFGFQGMAYDFLYDENKEPKIVEISYLYGGAGYPDFMNGYWDENLVWYEGRFWPQYFELMDLLNIPDLKLPELETTTSYKKANILS